MASIRERNGKFNVIYSYTNEKGERKQKWETYETKAEAKRRKKEIEYKNGKPVEKTHNLFSGYLLVQMIMTDEAWYVVRNTPGVTGFIGSSGKGAKPFPLTPAEVDKILGSMGISRLEIGNNLNVDDAVKVIGGPFASMVGKVKNIDKTTQKVEIALDLFGQETTVELPLTEIERI